MKFIRTKNIIAYFLDIIHLSIIIFVVMGSLISDSILVIKIHFIICLMILASWQVFKKRCLLSIMSDNLKNNNKTSQIPFSKKLIHIICKKLGISLLNDNQIKFVIYFIIISSLCVSFIKILSNFL